ncbi:MAG TPA: DUF2269 family protein [Bacillus sp. (in: firmicutes)]|uniref:DUF2269 family protein n=1 Tax=Bacillus litorisediminis TaxID=2922713 RepID=UPI001FB001D7|nr:DUF2269 family protein [Bacillus litorisediminis]HWO75993.1 DUF2269 family protein [Bacillus sp. (in: firmicutes)]
MIMTPQLRKFALTVHITCSVGWIGAVIGFLVLVVSALRTQDAQIVNAAWITMELIGWYAIVPLALASLLTGLIMSLGTKWGLFKHYWILIKLIMTILAIIVLLLNMQTVSFQASVATETGSAALAGMEGELIHAGGGLLVLLVIVILSVYKPQGITRYGQRKQQNKTN